MDAALVLLLAQLTGKNAPPLVQADPSTYAASNVTSPTAVTKAWSVLPSAPAAGTVYVLETEFSATWEAQEMGVGFTVGGTWQQASPWIAGGAFGTAATLAGALRLTVRVLTASTARYSMLVTVTDYRNSLVPGGPALAYAPESYTLAIAAGDTVSLGVLWGASAAGQGLTSYGSTFTTISS